jgi:hypothetical protein
MLLMCIEKILRGGRVLLALGVLASPMILVGCDEGAAGPSVVKTPEEAKAEQEKEKAAREAAYGKGGTPKAAPEKKSGAGSSSSKPG